MTGPDAPRLYEVLEATWPAARIVDEGPWRLREGRGGGQRVSAATAIGPVSEDDIIDAEKSMAELGQPPIFMIRGEDVELDAMLEARGYPIVDPVNLYVAEAKDLTAEMKIASAIPAWPPLALQREIWEEGGIGPGRLDVMCRAKGPKTSILGRTSDTPGGTAFVAADGDVAMVHAIEVSEAERRQGIGERLMHACANWAVSNGVAWLSLIVTKANEPANALYRKLGMTALSGYHYRRLDG